MTQPQPNVAASNCDHAYEVRILGGHPLSVRLCTLCQTPDWTDLYEQADALFRWGREEGLAGKPSRTTISAYDRPTEEQEAADAYTAALNTPPSPEAAAYIGARISDGTAPRRRVRRARSDVGTEFVRQEDMAREIAEQENEEPCEGDTPENGAWHSVRLHGKWQYLTQKMSTPEREYAADRVASYSRYLAECDNDPERGEPDGLRWWREAGR